MDMAAATALCKLLGVRYPLIQAGMAGGVTTPELVAAVSEAGGLGTLGAAYMQPEQIRTAVRRIRQLSSRPFAVNLFAVSMQDDWTRLDEVQEQLRPARERFGLPLGEAAAESQHSYSTPDWFDEQLDVLLQEEVPVVSTAFGLLTELRMRELHRRGVLVTAMVTTVREALTAEQSGADVIVAQGSDAGGHRSTFDLSAHPQGALVGTFSLVPQIVDAVRVPVVAAGGIMDGRGLAAALMLGAQGVQMGTRFLTADESGAHPAYQQALLSSNEESTVMTNVFSGRPARGISNAFIRSMELSEVKPLPFPSQNTLTNELRCAAAAQDDADYMSLWAGQGTRLLTAGESAAHIVQRVMRQAESLLGVHAVSLH
ncbi:nitronate monooxygenase [Paenibacillus sp. ACRRX]|uniref:NAD(P)H-dependent flavin oxidoreductase n=1 Tax=Paenibacillus sp. ACRRX TaxID=2918206 RepID=UPI001EF5D509|nr:nitronate monooxygenase [Paenibacillus sp. ACRRX]